MRQVKKIGIAIYHANLGRYPKAWLDQFRESLLDQQMQSGREYIVYELAYGPDREFLKIPGLNRYTWHVGCENYAAAMNEVYETAFRPGLPATGCDAIVNTNVDDLYTPNRIRLLTETLEEGAHIASSDYAMVNEQGDFIRRTNFADLNIAEELQRDNNIVSNPGHMMRREVFEAHRFDPRLVPIEDLAYWKKSIELGFTIVIRPEVLHYYRIHPGQEGNKTYTQRQKEKNG
jgi:hypothetical protein